MKALLLAAAAFAATAAAPAPHHVVSGSIPGPDGGWDYAQVDPITHRLFVARTDSVTVVDLDTQKAVASWGQVAKGHAAVPLPGNRLLVTSGNDATVRFLDATDGHQLASVAVGKKPDAAIYDAATKRAFVMNATDGTVSVIDTVAMRVSATIPVKPALEYAVLAKDGMLFINNEDANEVEVVDVAKGKLTMSIAMPGCEGPTGLGYDVRANRLISACANGKAVVIDVAHRRVAGTLDIGKGADAVIVDAARQRAYVPCGEGGELDVLSLGGAAVTRVEQVKTEVGARTGALDAKTGTLYLPSAQFGAPEAPSKRPAPIAGSFHVITVAAK